MTAFDKAREIAKTMIISNSFDRAAVEIANALLAYEPTPDARNAAQFALQYWWSQPGFPELSDEQCEDGVNRIASAITAAVAATEARVKAEIDELSHLVQAECDNAIGLLRRAESAEARVRELEAELRWLDDSGYLGFVAAKRVRRALGGAK